MVNPRRRFPGITVNYHIARDGQQIGTYSRDDVLARLGRGEIRPTDLAWCEGMSDWKPVADLFGTAAPAPSMTPVASSVQSPAFSTGTSAMGEAKPAKPTNYLVGSILVTIFCGLSSCIALPMGVVAIVFASQVDSKYNAGDYAGAQKASDTAKLWMWIGFGVGVVGFIIGFAIGFINAMNQNYNY
jgi:hypothetical protein